MAKQIENSLGNVFSQLWQLPVMLLSVVLLVAGVWMSLPEEDPHGYARLVDEVVPELIQAGKYDQAIESLDVLHSHLKEMSAELVSEYYLLRGDALYWGQRKKGWDKRENYQVVVDNYVRAEEMDRVLGTRRLEWKVRSLISIDMGKAIELLAEFKGDDGMSARQRLRRCMIELMLRDPRADHEGLARLIERYLSEPGALRDDRIWGIARNGELMLARGDASEAVGYLLRQMMKLKADNDFGLGELRVQLGNAYLMLGMGAEAENEFAQAQLELDESDVLNSKVLVGLGRIRLSDDSVTDAWDYFADAARRFPTADSYIKALVGKAECASRLGNHDEAYDDYDLAVTEIGSDPSRWGIEVNETGQAIEAQHDLRYAERNYAEALKLVTLEKKLLADQLPAHVLLKLASTHEQIARQTLRLPDGVEDTLRRSDLDAAMRGKVNVQYELAGDNYYQHAESVKSGGSRAYGDSLWRAGLCYDKAGYTKQAIKRYMEFIDECPMDPRQLEIAFRLGQAYQADGQLDLAIEQYVYLKREHPKTEMAYASRVPLARCYLDKGMSYWSEAEKVLKSVVTDNRAIAPESLEFRDALIELGRLYYRRGDGEDYERGIEQLDKAVNLHTDQVPAELLFQLGDAYRKSVDQIEKELTEPLPHSEKLDLRDKRKERLRKARQYFDKVIFVYEGQGTELLDDLQKLYLRNSYFYRGDCAYDLGQFENAGGAIDLYTKAVDRYENDPASLVGLVQIFNAYCELKQYDKARTSNAMAKYRLKRMSEEAFNDPDLPMTREHWQRWLDWTSDPAIANAGTGVVP